MGFEVLRADCKLLNAVCTLEDVWSMPREPATGPYTQSVVCFCLCVQETLLSQVQEVSGLYLERGAGAWGVQ